jgi:type II secretory pathway pseudopilin PulG
MSNVLIGIIGVILFIGLALAGALFLGPRFQESTNNARASASVQAVSQVASAANMFEVQEGRTAQVISDATPDNDDLVERNYLKSVPQNPTGGDAPVLVPGSLVTMELGNNSDKVCAAIAAQTGGSILADEAAAAAGAPSGCYGDGTAGYNAYARI